jgi:hypothetical protein
MDLRGRCAIVNVLGSVQKGSGQLVIRAPGEIDHVVRVLAWVAMHEEAGTRWTALLALFGIPREGRVAKLTGK